MTFGTETPNKKRLASKDPQQHFAEVGISTHDNILISLSGFSHMSQQLSQPVVDGVWKCMRGYQKDIVLQCCNRMEKPPKENERPSNCVALLPTGLGKTMIGGAVIEWFLSLGNRTNKIVVVLTPTTILADQQSRCLGRLLNCKIKVQHGQSNRTRKRDFDNTACVTTRNKQCLFYSATEAYDSNEQLFA